MRWSRRASRRPWACRARRRRHADGLRQRISEMENRLQDRPQDAGAAVLLADALLRQSRVTGDGRLPGGRAAC